MLDPYLPEEAPRHRYRRRRGASRVRSEGISLGKPHHRRLADRVWILLGPFAFANVAGWMTRWNKKISFLGIRLAGMGLTALFVAQLGYLFLVIPLEKAGD